MPKRETHNYTTIKDFDKSVIHNAQYFTAFLYGGPFNRYKVTQKTMASILVAGEHLAKRHKENKRPVMIYAVSNRHSVHVGNIEKE